MRLKNRRMRLNGWRMRFNGRCRWNDGRLMQVKSLVFSRYSSRGFSEIPRVGSNKRNTRQIQIGFRMNVLKRRLIQNGGGGSGGGVDGSSAVFYSLRHRDNIMSFFSFKSIFEKWEARSNPSFSGEVPGGRQRVSWLALCSLSFTRCIKEKGGRAV